MDHTLKGKADKKSIEETIRRVLKKHGEILFAYLHGSFVAEDTFQDIDIAVYLEGDPGSVLEYELKMETELMQATDGWIIDVRVLNTSPLSFRYNVIKNGLIVAVRDDDKRTDFEEASIVAYLDFLPYRNMYLEEIFGVKV